MNPRLQTVLSHPLHQFLGVVDIHSNAGQGEIRITVMDKLINPAGLFHGGVVYVLSDVCAYAGLLSLLSDNEEAVTHDLHVSVLRPAMLGDEVVFRSEVVKRGRQLCFLNVTATVDDKIIATARVTKSIISQPNEAPEPLPE
ncbi:MAG: PaaI family thioesterase [Pseudomonadota bacterium]|nr:PaaI family thioesterase [Pseudomonadota bacterium]